MNRTQSSYLPLGTDNKTEDGALEGDGNANTFISAFPGGNAQGFAKVGTLELLFSEWVELHPVQSGGREMQKHRRLYTENTQNKFCAYGM